MVTVSVWPLQEFLKYTYLWSSDVHVMFQTFLEQAVTSGDDDADAEGRHALFPDGLDS